MDSDMQYGARQEDLNAISQFIGEVDLTSVGEIQSLDIQFEEEDTSDLELDTTALEIDLDSGEEPESFRIELSEEIPSEFRINPALLGFSQIDFVENLKRIAGHMSDVQQIIDKDRDGIDPSKCKINSRVFSHVPPAAAAVIQSALQEEVAALAKESRQTGNAQPEINYGVIIERVYSLVWDVTGWSPVGAKERTDKLLHQTIDKFFTTMTTTTAGVKHRISDYIDTDRFNKTQRAISLNAQPFMQLAKMIEVAHYFDDNTFSWAENGSITELAQQVCRERNPSQTRPRLRVKDWLLAIGQYLTDPEVCSTISLAEDQIHVFTTDELTRRLFIRDLEQEMITIDDPIDVTDQDQLVEKCFYILQSAMHKGSVICEIILIVATMYEVVAQEGDISSYSENLLKLFGTFLWMRQTDPELTCISFYTGLDSTVGDDGSRKYLITYPTADGSAVHTVESPDILCITVGNTTESVAAPIGIVDSKSGYFVLPQSMLVKVLQNATVTPTYKLDVPGDDVVYEFKPSLDWLSHHGIVVDNEAIHAEDIEHEYQGDTNLLEYLDNCEAEFDGEFGTASVTRINSGNTEVMAMEEARYEDGSVLYRVLALHVKQSEDDFGSVFVPATGRVVIYEDGGLILEISVDGKSSTAELSKDEYTVQNRSGVELEARQEKSIISSYVAFGVNHPLSLDEMHRLERSREVSKRLCRVVGGDYETYLEKARTCAVERLGYILGLYKIDVMLTPGIIKIYQDMLNSPEKHDVVATDANAQSVMELKDIALGRSRDKETQWDDNFEAMLKELNLYGSATVSDYVRYLDKLDFKTLALEVLSNRPLHRVYSYNVEEMRRAYDALLCIEPVRCRLRLLEEYMIDVLLVFENSQAVASVMLRDLSLRSLVRKGVSADTLEDKQHKLASHLRSVVGKAIAKTADSPLAVTEAITKTNLKDSSSLVRYFILSRDLHSLVQEFNNMSEYAALSTRLKIAAGFDAGADFSAMSVSEFKKTAAESVVARCFSEYEDVLTGLLYEGILSDISRAGYGREVMLYDLLRDFGRYIYNSKGNVESMAVDDIEPFLFYANSFITSYCPVTSQVTSELDSGATRDMMLKEMPDDFFLPVYYVPGQQFVYDMRLTSGD